ncbi:RNA-dependent RNA polymerase [Humulus lupulus mitovirus 1]|uniref:RNA-dependent RNA polymerase n=1 Tax=Humulus lupulus mitovirus 1 TaxID=2080461 RepID=A0ABM9WIP2_9VIRU|nr:RNA-dependent RNA polymerase [Humulus lupulus mitovirus 1]DAB41749.1 TPA_inf: RNA-dependent RNA polymerase [Humulus lupulus mitovirus 1]
MTLFTNFVDKLRVDPWRGIFEHTRRLRGFLIRIQIIVASHPTLEVAIASISFARKCKHLAKQSGLLFTALYLKQCSVCLQQYYARCTPIEGDSLAVYVSLSKSGIPRIIPRHHRNQIGVRDARSDYLVKLYLSWFSVNKIVKLAKPVKASTFESIVQDPLDIERVKGVLGRIKSSFPIINKKYLPWLTSIPLHKGMKWVPTWKSTPNDDRQFHAKELQPTIFTSLKHEIAAFAHQLNVIHSFQDGIFSPGILFRERTLWPLDYRGNAESCNQDLDYYERSTLAVGFQSVASAYDSSWLRPGRLAQVVEGGGKRRIFGIGNYIKQRLLHPVHDWAMQVLSRIPTDGTFDQNAPIHRLAQKKSLEYIASFDLKSATDRWPVSVIHDTFAVMFGSTLASCVVNGCLALNSFWVGPPITKKTSLVCFRTGQPLGYYGSWALFALSHHYIVWLAAERIYPDRGPFLRYALLGDDIVIADKGVAEEYRKILDELGVTISLSKSIISEYGALEFAKQFWVNGIQKNLSPVAAKAVLVSRSIMGLSQLADKYGVTSPSCLLRMAGAGFRVRSSIKSTNLGKKWKRLLIVASKPPKRSRTTLHWWLSGDKPMSPYVKAIMVRMIVKEFKPKELKLPEDRMFEGEMVMSEYTLTRNWLSQWLRWLLWYCQVALGPDPKIYELLDCPVIPTTWQRSTYDVTIKRFGLLWKCYDIGCQYSSDWFPSVLEPLIVGIHPSSIERKIKDVYCCKIEGDRYIVSHFCVYFYLTSESRSK